MKSLIKYTLIIIAFVLLPKMETFAQADEQLLQVGNEMYNFGDKKDALEVFKQALEINPNNVQANYMTGKCYIETIHKEKSLNYFLKAFELDPSVAENILYLIGQAYHLGYKFDDAILYYRKYMSTVPNTMLSDNIKFDEIKKAEHKIAECNVAKELVKQPQNILIENLGPVVNSVDEDYAPVISSDESVLYFTSRRAGSTGDKKDNDNEFFEDIFVSRKEKGVYMTPQNLGKPVNSELHDACIGLSPDGKQLFIYKDNDKYKGDIFICKLGKDGKWSNPSPIGGKINTPYIEKAITISSDGKKIFFSSNRPGGSGGMDIYMSRLRSNGDWEDPVNLGAPINTAYDDDCPFLASDDKTLYFSSKGHSGMGGFDVYKSVFDEKKTGWSHPENLKYPINSPDDDIYFVLSGDGKVGYYASVKQDEVGDVDLYRIYMPDPDDVVKPEPLAKKVEKEEIKKEVVKELNKVTAPAMVPVKLQVKVVDSKGKSLAAHLEIVQVSSNQQVVSENLKEGNYNHFFNNKNDTEYLITVEKDGYIYKSHKIKIPAPTTKEVVYKETFELEEAKVGVRRILNNIYFEYNQANIKTSSEPELEKLLKLLNGNPGIKMEIDGHTDNQGSKLYNIYLSQRRAESVINWLIKKGISPSRLKAKGFGEQMPIATNDDEEEGRELNRRTEFVIIK